jgi:putative membrane-bound dehydrogenase-like protein
MKPKGCIKTGMLRFVQVFVLTLALPLLGQPTNFPTPFNTQNPKDIPLSPREALLKMSVPPGFNVSLFAGEPDVQQPIGMTTDDRGRLWITENYTYAEAAVGFEKKLRDRIVILEDTNHDGQFDKRTVFWDQGQKVTSALCGFGGVWVLAAPKLLFIPDRNGDDIPDGEPEVVLDGWAEDHIQHNIVNGLIWGPDGWLYGRHGILATSSVGKPGTPAKERTQINCGIWRYHPTKKMFEVVAHGTTNPWGMDFDEYGEGFFINTVIGHLWHLIPGAHYKRMYGQDFNPRTYDFIDQHADHYHWDTGKKWTETRDNKGSNDELGGGHAHSGLMFYLGDNWPERYRNTLFTVNLHGYRLNNELIERSGSGFVGKHGKDFLKTSDIWFRAVDLTGANDGGVFLSDWSDTGECHESDGVHRSSGRLYKIVYGSPRKPEAEDVSKLGDSDLVKLQLNKNDWWVRHARRVLQERADGGKDLRAANAALLEMFNDNQDVTRKLRAMWALHATGAADNNWLVNQLGHSDEHVRFWAIRFLTESMPVSGNVVEGLNRLAKKETSAYVRLALASAMQRIPPTDRIQIATALSQHAEDANDHNLPLMLWYGVEPLVGSDPQQAISLAIHSRIPLVRKFIARCIAEDTEKKPEGINALVLALAQSKNNEVQQDVLQGVSEGLKGWRTAKRPEHWPELRDLIVKNSSEEVRTLFRDLSLLFGDEKAIAEVKAVVLDNTAEKQTRRAALQKLLENKPADLQPLLLTLLKDTVLAPNVAQGLAAYDTPNAAHLILQNYQSFAREDLASVIATLASRTNYAIALLDAVAAGQVPRTDISAYDARQISSLGNNEVNEKLAQVWGVIHNTGAEKKATIAKFKALLTADRIKKADPAKGRQLFSQVCALCHTLYGEGAKIGPDLTGSGRNNLDYLLENVIDPSAIVGADFKMVVVTMKDGRILNGVLSAQTDRTITLQSLGTATTLERHEILDMKNSATSLMPEGILESFPEDQVADLLTYLMSTNQVALPQTSPVQK